MILRSIQQLRRIESEHVRIGMGVDIVAFVEYRDDTKARRQDASSHDKCWMLSRFSLSRNYTLFRALGYDGERGEFKADPLIPLRGIPSDLSVEAAWEYYYLIEDGSRCPKGFWPEFLRVSKNKADALVRVHGSQYGTVFQSINYNGVEPRVWETVSKEHLGRSGWLRHSEVLQSLDHYGVRTETMHWDFRCMLECLGNIDRCTYSDNARLVFWFAE